MVLEETTNKLLLDIYHDVMSIEQSILKGGQFNDISVTEMHTIEAIGLAVNPKRTMSEVAKILSITVGTLTVATNNLTSKGYVERTRSDEDRRIVRLSLTKKGRVVYRMHEKFHKKVTQASIQGLTGVEEDVLKTALINLHIFLRKQY